MTINGYTRICGLMGSPIEHTMSPFIHNTLAGHMGINLAYVPFHVKEGLEKDAVEGAWALNLLGMNVTVPYKSRVLPYLSELDFAAARIGAVNTLVRTEKGFKGYNTDMPGLLRAMNSDGVRIAGEHVLILGAGGVARAVSVLMLEEGAEQVVLLNRSRERAEKLAKEMGELFGAGRVRALGLEEYKSLPGEGKYLAIQATSVGMFPRQDETAIPQSDFYDRIHTGYDLIFNPPRTRFMELVESAGGQAFNGLKMLFFQAVVAYELWTGCSVSEELADRVCGELMLAMDRKGRDA